MNHWYTLPRQSLPPRLTGATGQFQQSNIWVSICQQLSAVYTVAAELQISFLYNGQVPLKLKSVLPPDWDEGWRCLPDCNTVRLCRWTSAAIKLSWALQQPSVIWSLSPHCAKRNHFQDEGCLPSRAVLAGRNVILVWDGLRVDSGGADHVPESSSRCLPT